MYTTTATRVLKSFGFTPSEWNWVSRALASDGNLRNRVLNQAKLYGLASTIETGSLNVDDGAVPKLQIPVPENEDDLVRFAAVARRVEIAPSTRRSLVAFHTGRAKSRITAPAAARAARQVAQGRRPVWKSTSALGAPSSGEEPASPRHRAGEHAVKF